ncbi:hypothetical protein D3C78_1822590 [compost metagenome]
MSLIRSLMKEAGRSIKRKKAANTTFWKPFMLWAARIISSILISRLPISAWSLKSCTKTMLQGLCLTTG